MYTSTIPQKLSREQRIITTISDIITTCDSYFTQEANEVTPSYPSVFKWPRQLHNITNTHKSAFHQILAASIDKSYRILTQLLGSWTTTPTTFRKYRTADEVVYSGNAHGQWSSHSHIPQPCQLHSNKAEYSLNGELNVPLPQRHQIVDVGPRRYALIVAEHQLPEIEIQQQITDVNQISRISPNQMRQSAID